MHAQGFDVLTWRKVPAADVDLDRFADVTYLDDARRGHQWRVAATTVPLPVDDGEVVPMRQVTLGGQQQDS